MAEQNSIKVAVIERCVYLKPFGFAMQENSLGIPDFLAAMFRAGCTSVTFDLKDCTGMDSTFLGVIADAATSAPHRPGKTVVVLNATEGAARQLRRIGLLPLVCLCEEKAEPPAEMQLSEIDFVHLPRTEHRRLEEVKRLHEELARLNEKNRRVFGSFIAMLNEELQRSRQQQEGEGGQT